jgi:hypothetical protein
MEISLLSPQSIRIKGKTGSFVVNPQGKIAGVNGIFLFKGMSVDKTKMDEEIVVIKGPGEYELGGVKISGIRVGGETVYSMSVDSVDILLGKAEELAKDHAKLKEHNIVILYVDTPTNASFVTALAPNVVLFYGEKSEESITNLAKDSFKRESKYVTTLDKLPTEMETVLLS